MKKIKLIIFILMLPFLSYAQSEGNVLMLSGEGNDRVHELVQDRDNNTYIIGTFEKGLKVKGHQVKSTGGQDIFVAKVSNQKRVEWIKSFGGKLNEEADAIAISGSGDIYIMGTFMGSATIGNKIIKSAAAKDVFISRIDPAGEVIWTRTLSGRGNYSGTDLKIDHENNIYGMISYNGTLTLNGTTLVAEDGMDALVFRMSPEGRLVWTDQLKGIYKEKGASLGVDAAGNIYATGNFSGTAQLAGGEYTADGNSDIFLIKYSPAGEILWVNRSRGEDTDEVNGIAVTPDGNVFLTGSFRRDIVFDSHQASSVANQDIFLVKFNDEGIAEWLRYGSGGIAHDRGNGIAIDQEENVYLTGMFTHDITFIELNLEGSPSQEMFVAVYSKEGMLTDLRRSGGIFPDAGINIASTLTNEIITAGHFNKVATVGDTDLISAGGSDIFIWAIPR